MTSSFEPQRAVSVRAPLCWSKTNAAALKLQVCLFNHVSFAAQGWSLNVNHVLSPQPAVARLVWTNKIIVAIMQWGAEEKRLHTIAKFLSQANVGACVGLLFVPIRQVLRHAAKDFNLQVRSDGACRTQDIIKLL